MTDDLAEAVHDHRLASVAEAILADPARTPDEHDAARQALATCERIGTTLERVTDELRGELAAAGVEVDRTGSVERQQNHTITFHVADVDTAERAIEAIGPLGFERWEHWERGALESFRRTADQMTAGRTTAETLVVRFRWKPRRHRRMLERALTPNAGDWDMVALPRWAWWAYPVVRITRLIAERAGLRERHRAGLGPFLSTPSGLIPALVRHVGLDEHDLLIDLGCGDGRVVVQAAELVGCRARGVETDAGLVKQARRRAAAAGVDERVRIDRGDARVADISDATVIFVFLPIDVFADLLPRLIAEMKPGARLIAHEQTRTPATLHPPPTDSMVVLGEESVTVAHRWIR